MNEMEISTQARPPLTTLLQRSANRLQEKQKALDLRRKRLPALAGSQQATERRLIQYQQQAIQRQADSLGEVIKEGAKHGR